MEEEGSHASAAPVRVAVSYEPQHSRFLLRERKYALQYSHIYTNRLSLLRPFVLSTVRDSWGVRSGASRLCPKIVDLRPEEGRNTKPWVVCGCIYKEMTLKPSVLDTYSGGCQRR